MSGDLGTADVTVVKAYRVFAVTCPLSFAILDKPRPGQVALLHDDSGGQADSDFEIEVRQRLERHGYQVDAQVGVSRYRIDLGVRNPDRPGVYLAGIECDGASYHSSKSARDRDRLRQDCLQGAGWDILRVWSTDWFDDPDGQTDKLIRELEVLRQQAVERSRQEEAQRLQRLRQAPLPESEEESHKIVGDLLEFSEDGAGMLADYSGGSTAVSPCEPPPASMPPVESPAPGSHKEEPNPGIDRPRFVVAQVADCGVDPDPDRFYETSYRPVLRRMVHHVIDTEGPIYHSELVTRIARAHAFQRNGGKIEERVLAPIGAEIPRSTEADGKIVYWPHGRVPASVVPFRYSDPDTRSAGSIPLAELAGLARELLTPDRHDGTVIERMREQLGLGRLREVTRRRLTACIKMAREHQD